MTQTSRPVAQGHRRVLLVEDEPLVAMVVEDSLRLIGFDPHSVRTGAEALRALDGDMALALAVIDVGLPDVRGDELAMRARAMAPSMPIIVASGYDEGELNLRFAHDPATAVLGKPYTEGDLARVITSLGLTVLDGAQSDLV